MVFAPINGQPIYWDITAPPRYDATKSVTAQIPVQLAGGTPYTVFMQDSTGFFGGVNPTQIQISGIGPSSSCLEDVIAHTQDFTFTVSGSTAMCEDDFQISYQDTVGRGPHNFTVLPLDSSTNPWDQRLTGGATYEGPSNWALNMTTGTRFTIMMNNADGYGAGGVGGVYQVAEGASNSCIIAPMYTTAAWPGSLQTTAILASAQLPTSVITSRSARSTESASDLSGDEGASSQVSSTRETAPPVTVVVTAADGSSGGGLSTGATAGIGAGVGVLALGAIAAGLLFWWRKKKRTPETVNNYARPIDLNDDGGRGGMSAVEPKVEPYPSPNMSPGLSGQPVMSYNQSNNFSQSNMSSDNQGFNNNYGAAAVAAIPTGAAGHQSRTSVSYSDSQLSPTGHQGDGQNRYSMSSSTGPGPMMNPYFPPTGPGQAGPLPSKSAAVSRNSYQSQSQSQSQFQGPPGALAPQSPGAESVSGSSSSGRPLPAHPGLAALSEAGTDDTKVNVPTTASQAGTQGHGADSPAELGPVFNIHRDAEAEPEVQGGTIDLPPMYQDVPQRKEVGSPQTNEGQSANR